MSASPSSKKCLDWLLLSLHLSHISLRIISYFKIYFHKIHTRTVLGEEAMVPVFKAAGGRSVFWKCHPFADLNAAWFSCRRYKIPWTWTKWSNCAILWQTHSREADMTNIKSSQKISKVFRSGLLMFVAASAAFRYIIPRGLPSVWWHAMFRVRTRRALWELKRISRVQTNRLSKDSCGSYVLCGAILWKLHQKIPEAQVTKRHYLVGDSPGRQH